jgi:hypothetical protein
MLTSLKECSRRLLDRLGLTNPALNFAGQLPFWSDDMAAAQHAIYRRVRPYTMTSRERVAALCHAVAYLEQRQVPGAIVECGVWRGGSMMAAALASLHLGATCRQLYLYDTFAGMPPPTDTDRDWSGRSAQELLRESSAEAEHIRAHCGLQEVRVAMKQTRYPGEKIIFVRGRVEETLPREAPETIALLRLDTDWYESTYHELATLYPRLAEGGVLIVDDYGHWQGARQAVDEFFARRGERVTLHSIDYTARLIVKGPTT